MTHAAIASADDRSLPQEAHDEYFCPVCGIELSLSNFLTPEHDYYCPYCATRQTPAVL
jgi:DNA-directed RNA polymerase subunit RPC12/RpoP